MIETNTGLNSLDLQINSVRWKEMKSIKLRLFLLLHVCPSLPPCWSIGLFVYNMVGEAINQIENYRESLVAENSDRELKVQVEAVVHHDRQNSGVNSSRRKLTGAEARKRAADCIAGSGYDDGKGYFLD